MDWQSLSNVFLKLVQSDFFGTLVAGAFGALFGAWGAQAVISRGQRRQALVDELNAVRSAQMLCFSIINRFLAVKTQHLIRMRDDYAKLREAHDEFIEKAKTHTSSQPLTFHLQADFETLPTVRVPTNLLERYVFERISVQGRALAAAVDLIGAIDSVNRAIASRNELIMEFRQKPLMPPERLIAVYLGVSTSDGVIDALQEREQRR